MFLMKLNIYTAPFQTLLQSCFALGSQEYELCISLEKKQYTVGYVLWISTKQDKTTRDKYKIHC